MKKILLLTAIFVASTSVAAFAGTINPGQSTSCKDASAIELEVVKTAPAFGGKTGFTTWVRLLIENFSGFLNT